MSEDTQLAFSESVTAIYGNSYLWISANLGATERISSISSGDKSVIIDQLSHVREVPSHPANTIVERMISNAWADVLYNGIDARTALDRAVIEESGDVTRKLQELGFLDANGEVIKPLGIASSAKACALTGLEEW